MRAGADGRSRPGLPWVDVWLARLDADDPVGDGATASLDATERARADRLRWAPHRRLFVAAHAAQRTLLARYAGTRPERLALGVGPAGKPAPITLADGSRLHFNLSHAGEWMALAVSTGGPVGVDIEQVRPREQLDDLVRLAFSAAEHRAWCRLPASEMTFAFHVGWTRKEAWLKAHGRGLAAPPDGAEISFDLGARPILRAPAGDDGGPASFTGESRVWADDPPLVVTLVALTAAASVCWRRADARLVAAAVCDTAART